MNNHNLRTTASLTKKERTELSRKAGEASGVARRENKILRELLLSKSELPMPTKQGEPAMTYGEAIALQVVEQAAAGNLKAIRLYAELTGQLTQRVELDTTPPIIILPHEKRAN